MPQVVLLYVTFPDLAEAERVGHALVERRLAACVNILPGMISHYRWRGAIERAEEVVMIAKTRASLADAATKAVRELHSYETPAIMTIPMTGVESNYLAWILDSTA